LRCGIKHFVRPLGLLNMDRGSGNLQKVLDLGFKQCWVSALVSGRIRIQIQGLMTKNWKKATAEKIFTLFGAKIAI
jgi:hypothetical protein